VPPVTHVINESFSGQRLDTFLARLYPELSRSFLAKTVRTGGALINGRPAKPSTELRCGQILTFFPPESPKPELKPDPTILLDIIYEDSDLLALNKPAGLTVHPGAGASGPTLAAAILAARPNLTVVGPQTRPGLVHRLDKNTSGVLVVAKNISAMEFLSSAFAERRVEKRYLAFVTGSPPDRGCINSPIGRHPTLRHKMKEGLPQGKPAVTVFKVLKRFLKTNLALVHLKLLTGRTHQARVHLASIGTPVLADPIYGRPPKNLTHLHPNLAPLLTRQFLHARRLVVPHPEGKRMIFRAPWPDDFLALLSELIKIESEI
jgi:23S rRNA pseudouridine1911/1915/1917 synthase